jgi:hypothetical protein
MGGFMPGAGVTTPSPANPFGFLTQQPGYPMGVPGIKGGQGSLSDVGGSSFWSLENMSSFLPYILQYLTMAKRR